MKKPNVVRNVDVSDKGSALVMVLLATLLLGTACIAILTAVGASSQNNTDALSETKAYYAAESGLQATINYLRNTSGMTYSQALDNQAAGTLPVTGPINVGTETSYSILISDPDDTGAQTTYTVTGSFRQADGTYSSTRIFTDSVDATKTTTFSYQNQASTTVTHPMAADATTPFGSLQITKANGGVTTIPSASFPIKFRLDFQAVSGSNPIRTFYGQIAETGVVTFTTGYSYELAGSTIDLCSSSSTCPSAFSLTLALADAAPAAGSLYGHLTAMGPYRLKLVATGYGPNGAEKQLESIIQRNFFNNIGAAAAITMLGPGRENYFRPGTSAQMSIDGVSVPSVVVSDTTGLSEVNEALEGPPDRTANVTPAPEIAGDSLPEWQQSPADMEEFLSSFRISAEHNGQIKVDESSLNTGDFGDYALGKGLTYCEADCTMKGDGGGILIVRGTLTLTGEPRFKGIIIVTGTGGVVRQGGGNKFTLAGNLIVAPYDPNDLAAGFVSPTYDVRGGPGDIEYEDDLDLANTFDNTSGISNFVLGVAEK